MKTLLLITAFLVLCTFPAYGQVGWIGLYVDENYLESCFYDDGGRLVTIFVVHKSFGGAVASRFMLINGGGFGCVYVGETPAVTAVGSLYGGISVVYDQCRVGDILLVTMQQFCYGGSPVCAFIDVVPDPAAPSGTIEVINCETVKKIGLGDKMWVNPDGECLWYCVHPTRQTTWGQIKTQY